MAKKTKKEKIMAEYRRKLSLVPDPQYKLPAQETVILTVNPVSREPTSDYSYVLSDLRRIAILTALAICAQLVLWYKLSRG